MSLTHAVVTRVVTPEIEKVYFEDAQNLSTVQEIHDAVLAAAETPDPLQTVVEEILGDLHRSAISPKYFLVANDFIIRLEEIVAKRRTVIDTFAMEEPDNAPRNMDSE